MGENSLLTQEQKVILTEISQNDFLVSQFYFTGGTALSEAYLKHRYSDDLDFFTDKKFDSQAVFSLVGQWAKKYKFSFQTQFVEPTDIFVLAFPEGQNLKLDFAFYPYQRLASGERYQGLPIDSLLDIAVNKLVLITQRTEVKDFVDLYYLLNKFAVSDLIKGAKVKFSVEIEPLILASHFVLVEDFEFLPRMIKPLALFDLKDFFRQQAKSLGKSLVEP